MAAFDKDRQSKSVDNDDMDDDAALAQAIGPQAAAKAKTVTERGFLKMCIFKKDEGIVVCHLQGRMLLAMDPNGFSDPYVKAYLWTDATHKDKQSKQKTSYVRKTLNPVWTHAELKWNKSQVSEAKCLEFQVWDYDFGRHNDFIGKIRIALDDVPASMEDQASTRWYKLLDESHVEPSKPCQEPALVASRLPRDMTRDTTRDALTRNTSKTNINTDLSTTSQDTLRSYGKVSPHRNRPTFEAGAKRAFHENWPLMYVILSTQDFRLYEVDDDDNCSFSERIHFLNIQGLTTHGLEKGMHTCFTVEYRKSEADSKSKTSKTYYLQVNIEQVKLWEAEFERLFAAFEQLSSSQRDAVYDRWKATNTNLEIDMSHDSASKIFTTSRVELITASTKQNVETVLAHNNLPFNEPLKFKLPNNADMRFYLENGEIRTTAAEKLRTNGSTTIPVGGARAFRVEWTVQTKMMSKTKKKLIDQIAQYLGPIRMALAALGPVLALASMQGGYFNVLNMLFFGLCVSIGFKAFQRLNKKELDFVPATSELERDMTFTFAYVTNAFNFGTGDGPTPVLVATPAPTGALRTAEWGSWGNADFDGLKVRGPTYLEDKVKIAAAPFMFQISHLNFYNSNEQPNNVTKNDDWVNDWRATTPAVKGDDKAEIVRNLIFVINWQIPCGSTWRELGCYFTYANNSPQDLNLQRVHTLAMYDFITGTKEYQDLHFKLIPRVVEGNFVVKRTVGQTPAILGTKLAQKGYYDAKQNVFELEVNVNSSLVAGQILGIVSGAAKSLTIDLAFLMEGQTEDKLPEVLVGGVRLSGVDLAKVPSAPAKAWLTSALSAKAAGPARECVAAI